MPSTFTTADGIWVLVDGESARVGLSVVPPGLSALRLPEVGVAVDRGEVVATLSASPVDYELRSPVAGTVVLVNESLTDDPSALVGVSSDGCWLFEVQLSYDETLEGLHLQSSD